MGLWAPRLSESLEEQHTGQRQGMVAHISRPSTQCLKYEFDKFDISLGGLHTIAHCLQIKEERRKEEMDWQYYLRRRKEQLCCVTCYTVNYFTKIRNKTVLGIVVHVCNPSTGEFEAGN